MPKTANPTNQTTRLMHIESLLEHIYDVLQDIRKADWLTPEIQVQIEQAQREAQNGEYEEYTDVSDLQLHAGERTAQRNRMYSAIQELDGMITDPVTDTSQKIDDIVYGVDKDVIQQVAQGTNKIQSANLKAI